MIAVQRYLDAVAGLDVGAAPVFALQDDFAAFFVHEPCGRNKCLSVK